MILHAPTATAPAPTLTNAPAPTPAKPESVEPEITPFLDTDADATYYPEDDELYARYADDDADSDDAEEPIEEPVEDTSDITEYQSKASQYDAWSDRWARDPAAFMSSFYHNMTPEQQVAFNFATASAETEEILPESQSDVETLYLKDRVQYQADRKSLAELPKFAQGIQQEFQVRDRFIHENSISNAILEAKLNGIMEIIGAKFPEADRTAIEKALSNGKVNYTEAVTKSYKASVEKAVKTTKQTARPRPTTLGSSANSNQDISSCKDLASIFRMVGNG